MKSKSFIIILIIFVLLALISYFMYGRKPAETQAVKMGGKLLSDLDVNAMANLTLMDSKTRVRLTKGESIWQVEERHGFPADFTKLTELAKKLTKLKIGRSFAATEESLARLALLDPMDDDAPKEKAGTRIILKDNADKALADIIIGSARSSSAGSGGQYLRHSDSETVYLVDGSFQFLKTAPTDWLHKDVFDIDEEKVRTVTCFTADKANPLFTVLREAAGKAPQLVDPPENRTPDKNKIDQLVGALSPLKIDDVDGEPRKDAATAENEAGLRLVYTLFDGKTITVYPSKTGEADKERYLLRVRADYTPPPAAADSAPDKAPAEADQSAAGAQEAAAGESEGGKEETDEPSVDPATEAAEMNQKSAPWTFVVAKWQFESLITDLEGLLEKVAEEKN